jgi:hypothetical protein
MTSNNSVGQATGKVGKCASFVAASAQYLSCTSNPFLQASGAMTCAAWVNLASANASGKIVAKWSSGATGEYYLGVGGSQAVDFLVATGTTSVTVSSTAGLLTTGVWHLVIGWLDTAAQTLNVQVDNGTIASTACTIVPVPTGILFTLGARSFGSLNFDGLMDEVALYNRALTSSERNGLWNGGAGGTWPFRGLGV